MFHGLRQCRVFFPNFQSLTQKKRKTLGRQAKSPYIWRVESGNYVASGLTLTEETTYHRRLSRLFNDSLKLRNFHDTVSGQCNDRCHVNDIISRTQCVVLVTSPSCSRRDDILVVPQIYIVRCGVIRCSFNSVG